MHYKANLAAANWKADLLNRILPRLQDEFEASLNSGTLLELEAVAASWADDVINAAVASAAEAVERA